MRKILVILLLGLVAGCANHYRITLTNDYVITTRGKPKLNEEKSAYRYKDLQGRPQSIPAFRIKEISPD